MRRVVGLRRGISSIARIGLAPPSTVPTVFGGPPIQKRANGIGRWSPAVRRPHWANAASTAGARIARCRSPYITPSRSSRLWTVSSSFACHGHVGEREQRRDAAGDHPVAAPVGPAREQRPAGHREAVEQAQEHGRRLDVAADQRQAEHRADGEHGHHRDHDGDRQRRLAARVAPGEHEPDRDADHERLAQRVAEVLGGPERHLGHACGGGRWRSPGRRSRAGSAAGRR